MNKLIPITALLMIIISCEKNQKADQLTPNEKITNQTINTDDEMIKEAQSKPLTTVAFSESDFQFGKIKKGQQVEHIYEVTNTGKNPLIISQVKPGCGCTAPDYTKEPIMPNKTGKITLKFDSSNFDGIVNKQADVYMNVERVPITLRFSADIQPN
jgi:hypothetical protein